MMQTTWMVITSIWAGVAAASGIITAIAAVVGCSAAVAGINTWQHQMKGTSMHLWANKTMKALRNCKRAFSLVRNPFFFRYEYTEEMLNPNGSFKDHAKAKEYAFQNRLKELSKAYSLLEETYMEAPVGWEMEVDEATLPIRKCKTTLIVAIQDYLSSLDPGTRDLVTKERIEEVRSIIESNLDRACPDDFTQQINASFLLTEGQLKKILRS